MSFGNLPRQDQTDTGAVGLGGEKRDEEVRGVCQPRAFVSNPNFNLPVVAVPTDFYSSAGFHRSVNGVSHQIYQQLLQLHVITLDHQVRPRHNSDGYARLQIRHAVYQGADAQEAQASAAAVAPILSTTQQSAPANPRAKK